MFLDFQIHIIELLYSFQVCVIELLYSFLKLVWVPIKNSAYKNKNQ